MRKVNSLGLSLIKSFEGCKLEAYQDQKGVWTIGYGCTGPEVIKGMSINQEQAEMYLQKKLEGFYHLDDYLTHEISDNQYSALICLAFNIGLRALKLSRLLGAVNKGDDVNALWLAWSHVNGVENSGLLRRRKAELELFHDNS